jgi:hypothetical protein
MKQAREQCGFTTTQVIEDIFPCMPLQAGLITLSITQPGSYMARFALYPPPESVMSDLLAALKTTFKQIPILRTRIILVSEGCHRVILSEGITWQPDLKRSLSELQAFALPNVGYGSPPPIFIMTEDNGCPCV